MWFSKFHVIQLKTAAFTFFVSLQCCCFLMTVQSELKSHLIMTALIILARFVKQTCMFPKPDVVTPLLLLWTFLCSGSAYTETRCPNT